MTEFSDKLRVDIEVNAEQATEQLGLFERLLGAVSNVAEKLIPRISDVEKIVQHFKEGWGLTDEQAELFRKPAEQLIALEKEFSDVIENMRQEWETFINTGELPENIKKFPQEMQKRFLEAREAYLEYLKSLSSASSAVGRPDARTDILLSAAERDTANVSQLRSKFRQATDSLEGLTKNFVNRMLAIAAPLAGLFATKKLFGDYVQTADELGKLSKYVQMNVADLYTWSKANEAAGGSATAFRGALENWVRTTHRSAEDFIKLGQRMHGMTEAEQTYFLKIHGLSREAMQIFTQSADSAQHLVDTIKETALTEEDFENARKFRQQWTLVGVAVEAVGTKLSRVFLPVVTKVAKFAEDVSRFISRHSQVIIYFFKTMAVLLGGALVTSITRAIVSGKGLIGVMRALGIAFLATPVGAMIAAFVALAAAVALVAEDLEVFSEGGVSAFEQILQLGGFTSEEIEGIRKAFNRVVAAVGELWEEVKPLGEWLIKVFAKGIVGILTLIGYVFAGIAWAINKIGAAFDWVSGVIDDLREMFNDLLTWIKDNLSLEGIKKNLGKLGDIAVDFLVNKYKGTDPDMAAGAGVVNNANANSLNQTNNQDITVNVYGDNVDPNAVGQSVGRNVGRANNQLLDYAYTAMNGAM